MCVGPMGSIYKHIPFYLSAEVSLDLKVYIDCIETSELPAALQYEAEELYVTIQALDAGLPLHSGSRSTKLPYRKGDRVYWNEWLALPLKIRDIPQTAQIVSVQVTGCVA